MQPKVANRFTLVDLLGRGGMSLVYRGIDETSGQTVAVKAADLDRWGPSQQQAMLAQFRVEAQALVSLQHPRLPRFLGLFEDRFLVMEFIEGTDLGSKVERDGPLPPEQVRAIMRELAEVLSYLHDNEVVFRDLKPSNVMITPENEIKLIDFGLAKISLPGEKQLTQTGARMVSPGFAAPEQYAGGTDARSDLYALGATGYFLLTGTVPTESTELASSMDPLQALPGTLGSLISRLMSLRRDQRPKHARSVYRELCGTDVPTLQVNRAWARPKTQTGWRFRIAAILFLLACGALLARSRPPVSLQVSSDPSGADVTVAGHLVGRTPCNITLPGGKGWVLFRKSGYYKLSDWVALPGSGQEWVVLRPGNAPLDSDEANLPGYYPPLTRHAPAALFVRATHQLGNFRYGLPSGTSAHPLDARRVELQGQVGRAELSLDTIEVPVGWQTVRAQRSQDGSFSILESSQGPLQGRAVLVHAKNVWLFYRFLPCPDVYIFTREVDVLLTAMGLT